MSPRKLVLQSAFSCFSGCSFFPEKGFFPTPQTVLVIHLECFSLKQRQQNTPVAVVQPRSYKRKIVSSFLPLLHGMSKKAHSLCTRRSTAPAPAAHRLPSPQLTAQHEHASRQQNHRLRAWMGPGHCEVQVTLWLQAEAPITRCEWSWLSTRVLIL